MNKGSLGIWLVGGVDDLNEPKNNFTKNQFEAMYRLLNQLKEKYPDAKILGHRDLPNVQKRCPCFDVMRWMIATIIRLNDKKEATGRVRKTENPS
ncbi:hypothetical protein EB008_05130 [bacterium]|nr:hypothetical protein [bacterium]